MSDLTDDGQTEYDDPSFRHSTYFGSQPGPGPVPDWVITEDAANQQERGLLKTGKEADVHLIERTLGPRRNLLAAKRYRKFEERLFRDDSRYRQGRRTGRRRADLAMAQGTRRGMAMRAEQWVSTEFDVLGRLWEAGASVPYPVQRRGHEIMLQYIGDDDGAAPRLVHAQVSDELAAELFEQAVTNLRLLVGLGVIHGDLSPYNLLVWDERLWFIDFPQAVDPILNADGLDLLDRDVRNLCGWFARRGVATDPGALFAELLAEVVPPGSPL